LHDLDLEKKLPGLGSFPEVTTQPWRLQRGAVQANYRAGGIVRSEDFLRQLEIMGEGSALFSFIGPRPPGYSYRN